MTNPAERPRDLSGLVLRGVGWKTASQVIIQILALVTAVVIARFLTPLEVGLAAEALVFGSLALVIVDFGFGAALVQRETLTEEDKSTAFWSGTILGFALMLIGIGLSWPIADIYGEPRVQPLFATLSLAFFFVAPGIVQGALLMREFEFRSLETRTIIATAASCATAMTLAVLGFGPWAIIAQDLVIAIVSTALLWRASTWRPRFMFSMASLRGMAAYTSNVFGTKVFSWGTINIDNFLIGRFIGAAPLGAYTIGYSVMATPTNRIAEPITQVFFPAFSQMRDPARIAVVWLRATRMIALVIVPVMLGLVAVAPDFVVAVFGEKWEEAIPVVQILAPAGALQALTALNGGILQSLDLTRLLFRFTVVLSVVTVAAFAIGIPWGIVGVSTAYLLVTVVLHPIFVALTARAVGITLGDWLRSIAGIVQAGAVMLLSVLGARELLLETDLPVGLRLVALMAIGALVFLPIVLWRAPEATAELRGLRERFSGRSSGRTPTDQAG